EDAVRVAEPIDVLRLAAAEVRLVPVVEQPAVDRVSAREPREADVAALLAVTVLLEPAALAHPVDELDLPRIQEHGQIRILLLAVDDDARELRVVGPDPHIEPVRNVLGAPGHLVHPRTLKTRADRSAIRRILQLEYSQ